MNDNDLRNISGDDYRRLMAEAYPSPKKDIRAAVMAQVAAEAEQSNKKAKILTRKRMNRFVKFGSMAACFVLLVTLGFRVVPMMMKDAAMGSTAETAGMQNTADYEYAADTAKTTSETATAGNSFRTGGSDGIFKAMLTDGSSVPAENSEPAAAAPEEGTAEEPAAAAPYAMTSPADLTAVMTEESVPEEEIIEDEMDTAAGEAPMAEEAPAEPILMMSAAPAADAYTDAEAEAVTEEPTAELVVEEEFDEIVVEEAVEECVVEEEIEECVVEEAVVEEAPAAESAAPEYYRYGSAPDDAEAVRRTFEYELKLTLSDEAGEPAYTDWMTAHGYADVSDWSIAELVHDHGISRERFTELHTALTGTFGKTYPGYAVAEYDLDVLYAMGADITDSIARGDSGYVTDALYRQ